MFDAAAISSERRVLLRKVDWKINLLDRVDRLIRDPCNPLFVELHQRTMIAQRMLVIA